MLSAAAAARGDNASAASRLSPPAASARAVWAMGAAGDSSGSSGTACCVRGVAAAVAAGVAQEPQPASLPSDGAAAPPTLPVPRCVAKRTDSGRPSTETPANALTAAAASASVAKVTKPKPLLRFVARSATIFAPLIS